MKIATSRNDVAVRVLVAVGDLVKISALRGSRRYAWTARMPVIVSTNCTMTRADGLPHPAVGHGRRTREPADQQHQHREAEQADQRRA